MSIHISYIPIKDCRHPELTYGAICIKCGKCGRYDEKYRCVNCGFTEGKKPLDVYKNWGSIEFIDVFAAPICPRCKPLFKKEDRSQVAPWWANKELGYRKDFKPRKLEKVKK